VVPGLSSRGSKTTGGRPGRFGENLVLYFFADCHNRVPPGTSPLLIEGCDGGALCHTDFTFRRWPANNRKNKRE